MQVAKLFVIWWHGWHRIYDQFRFENWLHRPSRCMHHWNSIPFLNGFIGNIKEVKSFPFYTEFGESSCAHDGKHFNLKHKRRCKIHYLYQQWWAYCSNKFIALSINGTKLMQIKTNVLPRTTSSINNILLIGVLMIHLNGLEIIFK